MSDTVPAKTVVALYDDLTQARAAMHDLVENSFDRSSLSLIAHGQAEENSQYFNTHGHYIDTTNEHGVVEESMHKGASWGAVLGGLAGLLMGMILLPVPGVGPVLIAGSLASGAVWAGVGALAGGMVGGLSESGVPEEHAALYAEGVRRGGSLVVVHTAEAKVHQAVTVLNQHSPVDIEERAARWREEGWTGFDPEAKPYTRNEVEIERESYAR